MIPSLLPTYARAPLTFERGEGSWLIEADGRRFLDFASGIAVNALGHANPELVAVLTEQAGKLWHTSNLYQIPAQQKLADLLVEVTFADTVFVTNSGTETAELAIKMVRKHFNGTGRGRILTFEGAFHGRSMAAISAAGGEKLTKGFGPLLPGFTQLPWGDVEALRAAASAPDVAAIMLEPIQGEGGIRPLAPEDLREIRAICDAHGILLVLDEVQCGVGRTGRFFAHELAGITPDIMMVAKGIGGGFPLGAVLATEAAAAEMGPGSHGTTYGGNPLACAVGAKVVEITSDPAFLAEVARKGARLRQGLKGLVASHPDVFELVRGEGLMLGLRLRIEVPRMVEAARAEEMLVVPAGDQTVRLLPPLTVTDDEMTEALARLDRAASAIEKEGF